MPLHTRVTARPADGSYLLVVLWAWVTGDQVDPCFPLQTDPASDNYTTSKGTIHTTTVRGVWEDTMFSTVLGSISPPATSVNVAHPSAANLRMHEWAGQKLAEDGAKKEYSFLLNCSGAGSGEIRSEHSSNIAPAMDTVVYSCAGPLQLVDLEKLRAKLPKFIDPSPLPEPKPPKSDS